LVRTENLYWAFGSYHLHLFFNRQRFPAEEFQIPQHRKALSLPERKKLAKDKNIKVVKAIKHSK
jgi:hypothetical protein